MIFMSYKFGLLFYYFQCLLRLMCWWLGLPYWGQGEGGERKGNSRNYQSANFWDVT